MRGKINPGPNAALVTFPVFVVLPTVLLVIGGIITGGVTTVVLVPAFVPLSPGKPLSPWIPCKP